MGNRCDEFGLHRLQHFKTRHVVQKGHDKLNRPFFVQDISLARPVIGRRFIALIRKQNIPVFLLGGQRISIFKNFLKFIVADNLVQRLSVPIHSRNFKYCSGGLIHQYDMVVLIGHNHRLGNIRNNRFRFSLFGYELVNVHFFICPQTFSHFIELAAQFADLVVGGNIDLLIQLTLVDPSDHFCQPFSRLYDIFRESNADQDADHDGSYRCKNHRNDGIQSCLANGLLRLDHGVLIGFKKTGAIIPELFCDRLHDIILIPRADLDLIVRNQQSEQRIRCFEIKAVGDKHTVDDRALEIRRSRTLDALQPVEKFIPAVVEIRPV